MPYSNQLALSFASAQISDKQLALCKSISQLKIRTNILPPIPFEIYVPDNDESVPYAFMLSMDMIRTAQGCEKVLLSGYFSVLCAVLPHLTKLSSEVLESLGFDVKEIMVPSQKDVKLTKIPHFDYRTEVLSFAQLMYIQLTNNFKSVGGFWGEVAQSAGVHFPIYVFPESDVKALLLASKGSGLGEKLCNEIHSSRQALGALRGTPFGPVFSEARKLVLWEERNKISGLKTYMCLDDVRDHLRLGMHLNSNG